MNAPPPSLAEQAVRHVVETTGLPLEIVMAVTGAFDEFWRTREPALLTAMNARLTDMPQS
jgi:hypothetical protein